jgi:hypothetical protein
MTPAIRPLTFAAVDELGFAAGRGLLDENHLLSGYAPRRLGPLLELISLADAGLLPATVLTTSLAANGASPFIEAIRNNREHWLSPENRRMGFIKTVRSGTDHNTMLTSFLMDAQRAARDVARLPGTTPGQMAAAMEELENNIHEHSDADATGILAFRAARGEFEFVVADRGIGVLSSLRKCSLYASLTDHGAALESALKDGTSRFGLDSNRGHGYRPLFIGLVNLHGSLRFRTGDHALLMDGTSPDLARAQLAQKPTIAGLFVSVACTAQRYP